MLEGGGGGGGGGGRSEPIADVSRNVTFILTNIVVSNQFN